MTTTESVAPENACACSTCQSYCKQRPGFFHPDELAPLAARMHLTVKELFDHYLQIDPWFGDASDDDDEPPVEFWVVLPAIAGGDVGAETAFDPRGRCVFLTKNGRCTIHELGKPTECKAARHDLGITEAQGNKNHEGFARVWNAPEHQATIRDLLGRDPVAPRASLGDVFSMLFGGL